MHASILTLIFIVTKYNLIIRGKCEGCKPPAQVANTKPVGNFSFSPEFKFRMECINYYVRKAGTSNLFRCVTNSDSATQRLKYSWRNEPRLECIPYPSKPNATSVAHTSPHMSSTPLTASSSTPTVKKFHTATETRNNATTPGQIGFTTATHTVDTTTGTPIYSTVMITAKEKEAMTTSNATVRSTAIALTDSQYLTTEPSVSVFSGSISATAGNHGNGAYHYTSTHGIAAGVVLVLITGLLATAVLLIWCRRRRAAASQTVEMTFVSDASNSPFLMSSGDTTSCPSGSHQETSVHSHCIQST